MQPPAHELDQLVTDRHGVRIIVGDQVAKALAAFTKKLEACEPSSLLPGVCSGASDAADYLDERVSCRLCRMLSTAVGFERSCDRFDDEILNESCF